jgi:hypothetical protein
LGDGGAARGVLDSALSRYPSDMSLREGAFHLFEELGYFKSANTLASEIREMETEWREHSGIALFDSAWFKAVGHSEEEIAASVAVARSGLADAGFRRPRYDVWPTFCLGGPIARIAYELQIDGPSADLSTIETMVFEKLATAELAVEADGWISFSVARAVSVDVDSPERAI